MECLDYTNTRELFEEFVADIKQEEAISVPQVANEESVNCEDSLCQESVSCQEESIVSCHVGSEESVTIERTEEDDSWVQVLVPVVTLQKHIKAKTNDMSITDDDAMQEACREKVLEMYGSSKIEAIPLSARPMTVGPQLPVDNEPTCASGRLFVPPAPKRANRTANPAFRCPECLMGFTRADNLKRHFKILHEGGETFTCPHCSKSFARKNTLQRHITSQHTREKKYPCQFCDKMFIYSFEVAVHVQNVHSSEQGYPCSLCKAKFKWPRSLDRHLLAVHEGVKYKCTECDTTLSTLDAYKKHGARFHPTAPIQKNVVQSVYEAAQAPSHNADIFVCHFCRSAFRCKANLERHIDKIHKPQEGTIECEWCSNVFKSHETYERHILKFHEVRTVADLAVSKSGKLVTNSNMYGNIENNDMMEISLTEFLSNFNQTDDEEDSGTEFDFASSLDLR